MPARTRLLAVSDYHHQASWESHAQVERWERLTAGDRYQVQPGTTVTNGDTLGWGLGGGWQHDCLFWGGGGVDVMGYLFLGSFLRVPKTSLFTTCPERVGAQISQHQSVSVVCPVFRDAGVSLKAAPHPPPPNKNERKKNKTKMTLHCQVFQFSPESCRATASRCRLKEHVVNSGASFARLSSVN